MFYKHDVFCPISACLWIFLLSIKINAKDMLTVWEDKKLEYQVYFTKQSLLYAIAKKKLWDMTLSFIVLWYVWDEFTYQWVHK